MAFRIKNRVEIQILFSGKEFPFDQVNTMDFLHMACSTRLAVPMVHLRLKDEAKWLTKSQDLVDGAIIDIIIIAEGKKRVYSFRLANYIDSPSGGGTVYEIDGYWNAPIYWTASRVRPYKGTSRNVLQMIATDSRISSFNGENTADSQVWIPVNQKYHQFAYEIAKHGYLNDTSCMQLAFDLNGVLIYKNIAALQTASSVFIQGKFVQGSYNATDFRLKNQAGAMNAVSGYADETQAPSLSEDNQELNKVTATRLTSKMMMNTNVKEAVTQNRVVFRPINCGNTHANYEKALYQNTRLANLFSFDASLTTPEVTSVQLLDLVNYQANVQDGGGAPPYSGLYLVTSRVVYIQGANYVERIELSRQGLNAAVGDQV